MKISLQEIKIRKKIRRKIRRVTIRRKTFTEPDYTESSNEDEESDNNDDQEELRPRRTRRAPDYYGEWVNVVENETVEPKTMNEAICSDEKEKWIKAMENEITSLKKHEVWKLVELPEGRKAVGCKWVYKLKHDEDGNIERYKARLVAQGFSQKEGIDYDETFSPVVRFESIRTVIALAAQFGLKLHQMDVKTAFLNGELKEKIYMKQPAGYVVEGKEGLVCLLHKSLYGLIMI